MRILFGKLALGGVFLGVALLVAACGPAAEPPTERATEQGDENRSTPSTTTPTPASSGPPTGLAPARGNQGGGSADSMPWAVVTISLAITSLISVTITAWLFRTGPCVSSTLPDQDVLAAAAVYPLPPPPTV